MKFIIAFFAICCVSSVFGENPFGVSHTLNQTQNQQLSHLLIYFSYQKLTDAHLEAMKHIDANKLPAIFQQKRDASHWCCANEQPISTIQKTRVVKEIHTVATKVKTGYTECGFLSTMRCSLYSTKYKYTFFLIRTQFNIILLLKLIIYDFPQRQVAVYHVGTYEIPDETACFDHHVVCCKGTQKIFIFLK